jgi:hypothetical protein
MIEIYDRVQPDYTIKQYGSSDLYAVTKFHRRLVPTLIRSESKTYDDKLDNSISRARSMVKSYGFSNPWSYFCTLTLDSAKYDRHDLDKFRSDLTQWVRDERKRYAALYPDHDSRLSFLLIPERHKDGAWHIHGFLDGIPAPELSPFDPRLHPLKLVRGGYLNWPRYAKKFGFCSLGRIRDKTAAVLYAIKYILKDLDACRDKGRHLYMASRPLEKAMNCADSYGPHPELDKLLQVDCKFCSTGLVRGRPWWWAYQFDDDMPYLKVGEYLDAVVPALPDVPFNFDDSSDLFEQLTMLGVLG